MATAASTATRHRFRPAARLTEPLVRDDGRLRVASWEEALDRAAAGFRTARDAPAADRDNAPTGRPTGSAAESRADSLAGSPIGVFSCSKSTNEMNFVAQKLARVALGTNNIDSCNRT